MQSDFPSVHDPLYRTHELKYKVMKHFENRIKFWKLNYRSGPVYLDEIQIRWAVEIMFDKAACDGGWVEEVALLLRRVIQDAIVSAYSRWTACKMRQINFASRARQEFCPGGGCLMLDYDGIDISLLRPCRTSLHTHILSTSPGLHLAEGAGTIPWPPRPEEHGRRLAADDRLHYNWYGGQLIPWELVNILSQVTDCHSEEDDEIVVQSLIGDIYDPDDEQSCWTQL